MISHLEIYKSARKKFNPLDSLRYVLLDEIRHNCRGTNNIIDSLNKSASLINNIFTNPNDIVGKYTVGLNAYLNLIEIIDQEVVDYFINEL